MPGIIFTRYDRVPSRDDHAQQTWGSATIDRRRFLGGVSALAASVSSGSLLGGRRAAAQGTPAGADRSAPVEALRALLQRVPAAIAPGGAAGGPFYHADLAAQFAAVGVDRSAADWMTTTNLFSVTAPLALVSAGFQYGASADFAATFGFRPLDVDRALEVGRPPDALSIYQGGLDRAALEAAWSKTGFKQVSLGGGHVLWTLGEDGAIDLSSPVAPFGAGAFNNLLLLDDQTLLVARKGSVIRAVVSFATGEGAASMLDGADVAQTITALSPSVVSSIGVGGALLAPVQPGGKATPSPQAGNESMPEVVFAIFGIEAGARGQIASDGSTPVADATPEAGREPVLVEARLATSSAADAAQAAAVASMRWETMESLVIQQPYSSLMTLVSSGVSPAADTVAALDFDPGATPGRWIQMVAMQDLAPFAPGG